MRRLANGGADPGFGGGVVNLARANEKHVPGYRLRTLAVGSYVYVVCDWSETNPSETLHWSVARLWR